MAVKNPIYLDYNATSSVFPEAVEAMLPFFTEKFGNSASAAHSHGWDAELAVELARKQVADLIGASPSEIVFTSGATESNNWCLRGLCDLWQKEMADSGRSEPIHILSSPLEHGSVSQVLKYLASYRGVKVDYLPIDRVGRIDISQVESLIQPTTRLVCASWVQNEIGTIQPIFELKQLLAKRNLPLLTDATQALTKLEISVRESGVDYLSFSAHKIGGPKGVGFLFIRKGADHPVPLFFGGGHEKGLRSATVNVPGVVGMGACAAWWTQNGDGERRRLRELQEFFLKELKSRFPEISLNGPDVGELRSPSNLNVCFRNNRVPAVLPGLSVSKSSACNSGPSASSYALKVLGLTDREAESSIRFSIGRGTDRAALVEACAILEKCIRPTAQQANLNRPAFDSKS